MSSSVPSAHCASPMQKFTIGPYPTISLKEAREKRDAVHGLLVQGLDPNEQYRAEQKQQDEETPLTSRVVAQEWYAKRTVTQTENTRRLKMQRLDPMEKSIPPVAITNVTPSDKKPRKYT